MTPLRTRLGAALAVTLLGLTACSQSEDPQGKKHDPDTTASSSPSADDPATEDPKDDETKPSVVVDPKTGKYDFCSTQKEFPFTGAAADKFGAQNVMDAYCEMVDLQLENSLISSLLRREIGEKSRAVEFSPIRDYMTSTARKSWDEGVAAFIKDDTSDEARGAVWGFMWVGLSRDDLDFADDSGAATPDYFNLHVTPAKTDVDTAEGFPRLQMSFSLKVDLNQIDKKGKHYLLPARKDITVWLVKNPAKDPKIPWLIDGWRSYSGPGKAVKNPALDVTG